MFCARDDTKMAMAAKLALPARLTRPSAAYEPATCTPNTRRAKIRMTAISKGITARRDRPNANNKCRRRMGAASRRLSSLRTRISTITQPMPHMEPDMRFMAKRPGMRKSM